MYRVRGSLVECSCLLGVTPDRSCRLVWLSLGTCADIDDAQNVLIYSKETAVSIASRAASAVEQLGQSQT